MTCCWLASFNSDSSCTKFMKAFTFAVLNTLCQTGLYHREEKAQEVTSWASEFGINKRRSTVDVTISSRCCWTNKERGGDYRNSFNQRKVQEEGGHRNIRNILLLQYNKIIKSPLQNNIIQMVKNNEKWRRGLQLTNKSQLTDIYSSIFWMWKTEATCRTCLNIY